MCTPAPHDAHLVRQWVEGILLMLLMPLACLTREACTQQTATLGVFVQVAGRGVVLRGSLYRAVLSAETVWTLEDGELMLMLAKSD